MWSLEGVQQEDLLERILFYLTIQPLIHSLSIQMIVTFVDDVRLEVNYPQSLMMFP
jgi:hypothetical protein